LRTELAKGRDGGRSPVDEVEVDLQIHLHPLEQHAMKPSLHPSSVALALFATALVPSAQQTTPAPRPPSPPSPGQADAIAFPACAQALDDTSGPGCLYAASTPTLGKLFPLSSDFFIESATGKVGIGTTAPSALLTVDGTSLFKNTCTFEGNSLFTGTTLFDEGINLRDQFDTLVFPQVFGSGSSPMIEMFAAGTTNADRMVLAHSSAFPNWGAVLSNLGHRPNWGLLYRDSDDSFVFQSETFNFVFPTLTVDLGNKVVVDVPLSASSGVDNVSALDVTGSATTYSNPLVFLPRSSANKAP